MTHEMTIERVKRIPPHVVGKLVLTQTAVFH